MAERARPFESNSQEDDRVAVPSATRSTPLTMVSGVVAGGDLNEVASSASGALGRPVAIAIPGLGEPVVHPAGACSPEDLEAIAAHAAAATRGERSELPGVVGAAVDVRLGSEVVGIVAALRAPGEGPAGPEVGTWLEAAAAAAAVAAVMRDAHAGGAERSRRALLQSLRSGPPPQAGLLVEHARRLGFDLSSGAVAICATAGPEATAPGAAELAAEQRALIAEVDAGRVCALVPLAPPSAADDLAALAAELSDRGLHVVTSAPQRAAATLHHAVREAEVLIELDVALAGQEETYRLLIGILLREPDQLEDLRARTIAPLTVYDAEHDTDLVGTLESFLTHHGSTTDTAEAMSLHRHTVGYRLARVHEVSGLSPYESDGRERLGLGLKAHRILLASDGRPEP